MNKENVYWNLEKSSLFTYSEATKTHKTEDRIKTICGKRIGINPKFNEKEHDKDLICKKCFKELGVFE